MEGWIAVSRVVTNKPHLVTFKDRNFLTWRSKGRVEFISDTCKHRGMSLHLGKVTDNGRIECPYHGWTYDSVSYEPPGCEKIRLANEFTAKESDGLLWIQPTGLQNASPDPPELGKYWFDTLIKAPAQMIIENGIDPNHASWVHANPLGFGKYKEIPHNLVHLQDSMTFLYQSKLADTHNEHAVIYPYTTWSVVTLPNKQVLKTYVTLCPESHDRTRMFVGFKHDMLIPDQMLLVMGRAIVEQDRKILENLDLGFTMSGTPGQNDELIEQYRSTLRTLKFK